MSAVVLPAAIAHFTSTQVIFSNSTRSVFTHGAAHPRAEGNTQLASGACAMARPASAPARIVAKNTARRICTENVDIEPAPVVRASGSLTTSSSGAPAGAAVIPSTAFPYDLFT